MYLISIGTLLKASQKHLFCGIVLVVWVGLFGFFFFFVKEGRLLHPVSTEAESRDLVEAFQLFFYKGMCQNTILKSCNVNTFSLTTVLIEVTLDIAKLCIKLICSSKQRDQNTA